MNFECTNPDLKWNIGGFTYPEPVVRFLKRFENNFCIFSRTVSHLYSNYEMFYTGRDKKVVVLPNQFAHHDNYPEIPEEAILPTGMVIMPSEGRITNESGWILCYRSKDGEWKGMRAERAFEKFKYAFGENDPFLPVILNSDLRKSSGNERPLMHLHRISLPKLAEHSDLTRHDIHKTISTKLSTMAA